MTDKRILPLALAGLVVASSIVAWFGLAVTPVAADSPTVVVDDASVSEGETTTVEVRLTEAPEGLAGFDLTLSVGDTGTATITEASIREEFGLKDVTSGDGEVTLVASDTDDIAEPGATDVLLGTLTIRGEAAGETDISVTIDQLDADGGAIIDADTEPGTITVGDGGGGDGPVTADRSIARTAVGPGETTEVTVDIDASEAVARLSLTEEFSPGFETVSEPTVSFEGGSGSVTVASRTTNQAVVAMSDVTAGTTVVVTYDVTALENATVTHEITGEVSVAGDTVAVSGDDSIDVTTASGPVARADTDGDGEISDIELQNAIVGWAGGAYTDAELQTIILTWAAGG